MLGLPSLSFEYYKTEAGFTPHIKQRKIIFIWIMNSI